LAGQGFLLSLLSWGLLLLIFSISSVTTNLLCLYLKTLFFNEHMKHIEIDYQFITENILEGLLQFSYLPTLEQLADVFTKVLLSPQFKSPLHKLGMCDPI